MSNSPVAPATLVKSETAMLDSSTKRKGTERRRGDRVEVVTRKGLSRGPESSTPICAPSFARQDDSHLLARPGGSDSAIGNCPTTTKASAMP